MSDLPNGLLERVAVNTLPTSVRVHVKSVQSSQEANSLNPSTKDVLILTQQYSATSSGQRRLDEECRLEGGERVRHYTYYSDGAKCANVSYKDKDLDRQEVILLNHIFGNEEHDGFMEAPVPIRWYQVGLTPLHEAIPLAERKGDGEVIGRKCDVFHFKSVGRSDRPQSLVYFLDQETGLPLRVSAYDNPGRVRDEVPNWVWEAKSLGQVTGRPLVTSSVYSSYVYFSDKTGKPVNRLSVFRTSQVEKAEFDVAIPKSTFWPEYQAGVEVIDTTAHRTRTVPGGTPETASAAAPPKEPIRVPDSGGGGLFFVSAGLIVSLLILGAALILRRRS